MAEQLELFPEEKLQQQDAGSIESPESKTIEDVEWCFQFFNNEPEVFAWSNEGEPAGNLSIELKPLKDEGLSFSHNGMAFRIFPREISEETKLERANLKGTDTNESKD